MKHSGYENEENDQQRQHGLIDKQILAISTMRSVENSDKNLSVDIRA